MTRQTKNETMPKDPGMYSWKAFFKSIKPSYDFYSNKIIPKIGKLIAKNENAYQYLTDSIHNFYHNPELKNIFNKNGFFCYNEKKYLGGIAILNVFSKV